MWSDQDAAFFGKLPEGVEILKKPFMPSDVVRIVSAMIGQPKQLEN
jgi:hypothetical protein